MTRKYSTTHCLDLDEDGVASALVTVRLQGVSLLRATMFVDAVLATAGEYVLEEDRPTIQPPPICETVIRPQTSGPCVHLDEIATDDPEEVAALGVACRHPGRTPSREDEQPQEWECPHMDNPEITCPIHDACEAMYCVMRARDECEAEQEEQDAAMAADPEILAAPLSSEADAVPRSDYVLAPPAAGTGARVPEFEPVDDPDVDMEAEALLCPVCDGDGSTDSWGIIEKCSLCSGDGLVTPDRCEEYHKEMGAYEVNPEPEIPEPAPEEEPVYEAPRARKTAWSHAEDAAIRQATAGSAAIAAYRVVFGDNRRTDAAIKTRWNVIRRAAESAPAPTVTVHGTPWTDDEKQVIMMATASTKEAIAAYRARYPGSDRTDKSIQNVWCKARNAAGTATVEVPDTVVGVPDFPGDEYPITQCVDDTDGAPTPAPTLRDGTRVRINLPGSASYGKTGHVVKYYYATQQYLVSLEEAPLTVWVSVDRLEVV